MAYREKDTKKWTAQWFETNVMGEKKKRRKRGFETKRELSFFRPYCHISTISDLKDYFMKKLFLFSKPYLFIIISNLSIISFSNIVSLHSLIKQLFVNFFQIFISVTDIILGSFRIHIFRFKYPSIVSQ